MTSLSSYRELVVWQKSMDLDGKNLCAYAEFPGRGKIRDYLADATVGILHSGQYRGGTGAALDRGVCSFAWCCPRLFGRTRNVPDIVIKAGDDNAGAMQVPVSEDCAEINKMLNALIKTLTTPH